MNSLHQQKRYVQPIQPICWWHICFLPTHWWPNNTSGQPQQPTSTHKPHHENRTRETNPIFRSACQKNRNLPLSSVNQKTHTFCCTKNISETELKNEIDHINHVFINYNNRHRLKNLNQPPITLPTIHCTLGKPATLSNDSSITKPVLTQYLLVEEN